MYTVQTLHEMEDTVGWLTQNIAQRVLTKYNLLQRFLEALLVLDLCFLKHRILARRDPFSILSLIELDEHTSIISPHHLSSLKS